MPKLRKRVARTEMGLAGRSARIWKALDAQNRFFVGFGSIGPLPGELQPGEWGQVLEFGGKCQFWAFRPQSRIPKAPDPQKCEKFRPSGS